MSAAAQTWSAEQVVWQPKVNPWVIGVTVSMAAFLEVLDTSIANVALPYIAGNLGASYDDSMWVLTAYLAANAIVLPISGWLADGVLICSRAIGASVMASKQPGVRAALCHDSNSARRGMNLLVMGAPVVTNGLARELARAFIEASYVLHEQVFGIPPRRLARVIEHIRNNLDKPLSVNVLSRMAETSQSHFSKLFKLSTGPVRSAGTHQSVQRASPPRRREDCRCRAGSGIREPSAFSQPCLEIWWA